MSLYQSMELFRERAEQAELERQKRVLLRAPFISQVLEAFPECAAVLNSHRQIVIANSTLERMLNGIPAAPVLGSRLGEHLRCINAIESEYGCGTTEKCQTCGALISILAAQEGKSHVEECRLTMLDTVGLSSQDFRVYTSPMDIEGERFTIVSLVDVSGEKRRKVLERIFFHDVNNTAGGIYGMASILPALDSEEDKAELIQRIATASKQLLNEIDAQRDLLAAENDELDVRAEPVTALEILESVKTIYEHHTIARNRIIDIQTDNAGDILLTDETHIVRCLGNLVKNALEAVQDGDTVRIAYRNMNPNYGRFVVQNPGKIPRQVEMQIFQRSFSTKGQGRGIGTYSVKLLVERYLRGKVGFTTSDEKGTEFYIVLPKSLIGDEDGSQADEKSDN